MYMAHVCFYGCCSDCVGVCGNVCCVAPVVKDSVLALEGWTMLYVCVRGVMDVVFSVCVVIRGAVGVSCMGNVSVSSGRCCMFVSSVHFVGVLNAVFCMTC